MRKVYAIIICTIISIVLVVVSIVILPFCILMDFGFILAETFGEDAFYHSIWPTTIFRFADFVRETYHKLVNDFNPKLTKI